MDEVCIKTLISFLVIASLILPISVKAEVKNVQVKSFEVAYKALQSENVIHNTPWIETPAVIPIIHKKKTSHLVTNTSSSWGGQCVAFAKKYLGIFGTWGDGGRKLSGNSSPVVGAVIIFRSVHVGVVTAVSATTVTFLESNYDWHGHVRTRTLPIGHKSISRYHLFDI